MTLLPHPVYHVTLSLIVSPLVGVQAHITASGFSELLTRCFFLLCFDLVLDGHGLRLQVFVESLLSQVFAEAGLLEASEG